MAQSKSKPQSSGGTPDIQERLARALQKIDPNELEALVFGYLAGKDMAAAGLFAGDTQKKPDPLDDFAPSLSPAAEGASSFPLAINELATFAAPLGLDLDTTVSRDVTGDIINCIFAAFSRKGIPMSTSTVPSSIMAMGNWVSIGRVIFECIIRKYPNFTPYAQPSTLARFYGQPLLELAKGIRSVLEPQGRA